MSSQSPTLVAQPRSQMGKEKSKKFRAAGQLPGVVYGAKQEARHIILDDHEFHLVRQKVHGDQVLISLNYQDGGSDKVFIKDVQLDPVTSKMVHVDLLRVDMTQKIRVNVKVVAIGSMPLGVKEGGILEHARQTVSVEALPDRIPAHINVDASGLQVHEAIHVRQLPEIEGVRYLDDPELVLITILGKSKEEELPTPVAAAETAEGAPAAGAAAPAAGAPAPTT